MKNRPRENDAVIELRKILLHHLSDASCERTMVALYRVMSDTTDAPEFVRQMQRWLHSS